SWSFVLKNSNTATQQLTEDDHKEFKLNYTMTDSDGDTSIGTLTIIINGTNDAPTITFDNSGKDAKAVVSEEGLTLAGGNYDNGIPDHGNNSPSGDKTDSRTDSGSFKIADVD